MLKMGFHARWIDIMMRYVRSITYSVKINGQPRGYITLTKGLC